MKGYRFFIIVLILCVFCGFQAKKTAAEETEERTQIAEAEAAREALSGTQVIELASDSSDELPQDDDTAEIASDELPQDDAPDNTPWEVTTGTTALTMYETDSEAAPVKSYNGVSEGDTIDAVITYYDICYTCCGKTDGVTASGLAVHNGMANPYIVSLNWLPLGSKISIDGVTYTVADRGGTGLNTVGRVDIFVPEGHQKALELGRTECEITIIEIGGESNA